MALRIFLVFIFLSGSFSYLYCGEKKTKNPQTKQQTNLKDLIFSDSEAKNGLIGVKSNLNTFTKTLGFFFISEQFLPFNENKKI